jgi:hypothetical protein
MSRQINPLKLRPVAGRKRYSVVIEHTLPDGVTVLRPFDRHDRLGAFPDNAGSRWQARKQLRRLSAHYPSAKLWRSQAL